ncbi:MAG: hypothetical protein CBD16_05770 [Betaproteobacteria bacterium TMED156]|nr:MAG: hypothetical protein CBD16_05770 [Betaproteobacteria bacterium TMED156]|tara:strand:- start:413 stop:955 length:543 start_codon:yes stop_codon:yes gene_type:complete
MNNIILIGLMGAGKTTIGKRLAQKLSWDFVDTDQLVEERCGANISVIFEVEGEEGFRIRENRIIEEVMSHERQVIASGGGAPIKLENRHLLKKGFVIYIYIEPSAVYKRLKSDDSRPILNSSRNLMKKIDQLFNQRDPIYRELANHIVVGGNQSLKKMVSDLQVVIKSKNLLQKKNLDNH